jgi:protein subunit release factor A
MFSNSIRRFFATEVELNTLLKGAKQVIKVGEVAEIGLHRLNTFDMEFQKINDKMSSGTMSGAMMNRIRGRIDTLTNQSRIFNELKGILEDAEECNLMLEESEGDAESKQMIQEEINEL